MTAAKPAVSVRNRLCPKDIGLKPQAMAAFTSSMEKSPSGPTRTVTSSSGDNASSSLYNCVLGSSS